MLIIFAIIVGFAMAYAIGANDVANGMATAVGAKAIAPRQAAIIAGFAEFLGAIMFGAIVTSTISKGIVDISKIANPTHIAYGALSALIAASVWVLLATFYGMPVSTTHSIIGGMIGFGIAEAGVSVIKWGKLAQIVTSWFLSPFIGGLISYIVFKIIVVSILHRKNPDKKVKIVAPILIGFTFYIISFLFALKTLKYPINKSIRVGIVFGMIALIVSIFLVRRYVRKNSERTYDVVEGIFRRVQVLTSTYVCFSHGANDVANAIGPVALIYTFYKFGSFDNLQDVPKIILFLGGLGISVGVLTYGYKVMNTVGYQITELNNTRGFSIDFGTATTVLLASVFGLPISTTHTVVGAVTGVGLARGVEVVNFSVLKSILYSWLVTVPFSAVVAGGIHYLLKTFF